MLIRAVQDIVAASEAFDMERFVPKLAALLAVPHVPHKRRFLIDWLSLLQARPGLCIRLGCLHGRHEGAGFTLRLEPHVRWCERCRARRLVVAPCGLVVSFMCWLVRPVKACMADHVAVKPPRAFARRVAGGLPCMLHITALVHLCKIANHPRVNPTHALMHSRPVPGIDVPAHRLFTSTSCTQCNLTQCRHEQDAQHRVTLPRLLGTALTTFRIPCVQIARRVCRTSTRWRTCRASSTACWRCSPTRTPRSAARPHASSTTFSARCTFFLTVTMQSKARSGIDAASTTDILSAFVVRSVLVGLLGLPCIAPSLANSSLH